MPIIYQHNINEHTKLAVWHITEPESFFLQKVPLKKEVSHPHKRLQHLAGRYLLPALFPGFPVEAIRVADTRRPFLENEQYHFSISHCGSYAAAIVSVAERVGIDIEDITPRIERVKHKFVTEQEWAFLSGSDVPLPATSGTGSGPAREARLLTLLWSAKEVIFKWYGSGQLDFKAHMPLAGPPREMAGTEFIALPFSFYGNGGRIPLTVWGRFIGQAVLSYTNTR